jgi:hypothetical protein
MPRKPKVSKPISNAKAAVKQTAKQARQTVKTFGAVKKALSRTLKPFQKKSAKGLKKRPSKGATSQTDSKRPSKPTSKKSVSKQTPVVKQKRSELPSIIKLKNIKQLQGKSWASIVSDDSLLTKLDKLKRPDEYFVGSIFSNKVENYTVGRQTGSFKGGTHKFFRNAKELIEQLNSYVETYTGDRQKMIDTFTIATLGGSPSDYAREVDERIKHNREVALEERRTFGEVFGKTTETGKTKTFRDFAKDAARALKEAAEERDAAKLRADKQDKIIDSLLKRLTAVENKSKKKEVQSSQKGKVKNATKRSTPNSPKKGTGKSKAKPTKPKRSVKKGTKSSNGKATTKTRGKSTVKKTTKKRSR